MITNLDGIGGRYSFISQFIAINLPKDILYRLYGDKDYDDIEDAILYSRCLHENTHFIQNICTTYGLWKTHILRLAGSLAFLSLLEYRKDHDKVNLPFESIIPRNVIFDPINDKSFNLAAAALVLLGWVNSIDGPIRVQEKYHIHGVELPKATTHVHMVDPRGVHGLLAGKEITEFHARSAELYFLNSAKGISADQRDEITPIIWADPVSQGALRCSDRSFDVRNTESWHAAVRMRVLK